VSAHARGVALADSAAKGLGDAPARAERARKAFQKSMEFERAFAKAGGHLMTGHVDGVGTVAEVAPDGAGSVRVAIDAPASLAPFIAAKGSIAVDGVSLTVNGVARARFHVNLIPHTLAVTTLRSLAPGRRVNLEVDLIARYVARYAQASTQENTSWT